MVLINFLLVLFTWGGSIEPHYQITRTSSNTAVLFKLANKSEVTVFQLKKSGLIKQNVYPLHLESNNLFKTIATPNGRSMVPAYNLMGLLDDHLVLYHNKELVTLPLKTGLVTLRKPLFFPKSPKLLYTDQESSILIASLVTPPPNSPKSIGDHEFFHKIDSLTFTSTSWFGKGKPFLESFVQGDISLAFWWPSKKQGGIFYTKSLDLHLCSETGPETIITTQFKEKPPEGRMKIIAEGKQLLILVKTKSEVAAYVLTDHIWKKQGSWRGTWVDVSALEGQLLLVNGDGVVSFEPLL